MKKKVAKVNTSSKVKNWKNEKFKGQKVEKIKRLKSSKVKNVQKVDMREKKRSKIFFLKQKFEKVWKVQNVFQTKKLENGYSKKEMKNVQKG